MTDLTLFKPCVSWCAQSHLQLSYQASWILAVSIIVSLIGYLVLKSEQTPDNYLWVGEYLLLLGIGLVCAFLVFNHYGLAESTENKLSSNIENYLERLGDDAVLIPDGERVDGEWEKISKDISDKS